ncbi:MAG: sigma 54-interacting transcriptional regulator [Kiritimatiellae bacterium]|nr:sigma 54-interacting transcriptional regulator [Kiritimatiellia bacterium]
MKNIATSEISVLREIASAVMRERNVREILEHVLKILERDMRMMRGTFTLLEGDELRIEATTSNLNAEELAIGRYRLGEGITGLVAKTGKAEVVFDIRSDRRFLNRTKARGIDEPLSFICVPLIHSGHVIGTLSVDREMTGDTSTLARDVMLLEIIANLCAEAAFVCREQCAEREALANENRELRGRLSASPGEMLGTCPEMCAVYEQIRQVAPSDATVLIRGASGTGKELVARAIQSLSSRADGPFVVINCAALPESLVESELFGHEKGAFTDAHTRRIGRAEAAQGGTLFLDEIGDLTMTMQVKLLRFLQERTFSRIGSNVEITSNVRFIAATSLDLEDLMARKLFREDLYYRLSVFPITLPPLSARGDDVLVLAQHFLSKISSKYSKSGMSLSVAAQNMLKNYSWPGNVRELENCIERAVLTSRDGCIQGYDLPAAIRKDNFADEDISVPDDMTLDGQLAAFEKKILSSAMRRHGGNRAAAGRQLGVSPRMMNYRLKKAGLQ